MGHPRGIEPRKAYVQFFFRPDRQLFLSGLNNRTYAFLGSSPGTMTLFIVLSRCKTAIRNSIKTYLLMHYVSYLSFSFIHYLWWLVKSCRLIESMRNENMFFIFHNVGTSSPFMRDSRPPTRSLQKKILAGKFYKKRNI